MIFFAAFAAALCAWFFIPMRSTTRLSGLSPETAIRVGLLGSLNSFAHKFGARGRREKSALRDQTLRAIAVLVAELNAGHAPENALVSVGAHVWPRAYRAAQSGGDTCEALIWYSKLRPELRSLAACWQVGMNSGAGLADSISQLYVALLEQQEVRAHLEAELAGPRATGVTLGFLPGVGIVLGYMLGAEPLTWFFSSLIGAAAFTFGIGMTALGVWWTSRIAHNVEALL